VICRFRGAICSPGERGGRTIPQGCLATQLPLHKGALPLSPAAQELSLEGEPLCGKGGEREKDLPLYVRDAVIFDSGF
jgi:hypothetical protein